MLTGWDIYWITRLDGVNAFFSFIAMLASISILVLLVGSVVHRIENDFKRARSLLKFTIVLICVTFPFLLLSFLVPTTKEMFAIKILPKIVNNEDVKEIPSIAVKFTKEWLKKQLDSLKEEAVKKVIGRE